MNGNPEAHNAARNEHGHAPAGLHRGGDPESTADTAVPRQPPSSASGFASPGLPAGRETQQVDRLLRWYLASGRDAVRAVLPNFRTVPDPEGTPPAEPLTFDTSHAALTWFERERPTLADALRAAGDHELHDLAWRLPAVIYPLFEHTRHWHEWREINQAGLDAARALGNRHGQARNLLGLADAQWLLGTTDQALEHYAAALEAAREVDDAWVEGFALRQIAALRWERDADEEAPALIRGAIDAFHRAEDRRGEGMALLSLADQETNLGNTGSALQHCGSALAIFTDIADPWTVAWGQCFRADALASAGRPTDAIDQYQAALTVFVDLADLDTEAVARIGLGRAHAALGESEQARNHLGAALELLRSVEDPRADDVETELSQLPQPR